MNLFMFVLLRTNYEKILFNFCLFNNNFIYIM